MYLRPGFIVWVVGCTLTGLSTVVVGLRYYSRFWLMGSTGSTDHLMLVALLITWGNTGLNYYQDQISMSYRPSWVRIPEKRPLIEAAVRGTLISWYVYRITYLLGICFVKLSILFFYRSIASHKTFRRTVYATIAFVSLYTFSVTIASIFQCDNPSDSWDTAGYFAQFDRKSQRTNPPKCYNPVHVLVVSSAVNLISDVFIMLLPIPTLLGLRVPMNKRLALIGIFSIGIMAIVASCVRMWVMALWAESPQNSAHYGADLLLWGQVETNSGIISASVPFLRLMFRSRAISEVSSEKRVIIAGPEIQIPKGNDSEQGKWPSRNADEKDLSAAEHGESPKWTPFITVPASLSSTSRGSRHLEEWPINPHTTF